MSYYSKIESINADEIQLKSITATDVDITCLTGNVKINGIVPTGGGGVALPIVGVGDITVTGNITANGDGIASGKMEAQNITSTDNITITAGTLELIAGGVDILGNGNITLEGGGNINQEGLGKITSGLGGIESQGDIKTIGAYDLEIGKDIYFDGTDIYHRTNNPVGQKSYKDYKLLAGLNDANKFTGSNQFNSNSTEFSAKVSVGTRDPQSLLFTQNLALNTSGNIESKTINNATLIQCGNINCGNAGENEVRARVFKTRTNENNLPEGWTISQETPSNPADPLDNILQITAGAVGATVTITDSAFSGSVPNIELDPRTTTNGGKITTTQYNVGEGTSGYLITQPKVGVNSENLLIMAGNGANPKVVFDDYGSTTTLMTLEQEAGPNDGMLRVPKIEFGISGPRNRIYNLQSGPTNLNLNIQHASDSSEIVFQNNQQGEIMIVKKTEIILGNTIPLKFGNYSFRPQQYSRNITLTIDGTKDTTNFTNMIFNPRTNTDWTNVNTGSINQTIYNAALAGFYKVTVTQTALSSAGNYEAIKVICDYILEWSTQTSPDIEPPLTYGYKKKPSGGQPPVIDVDHTNNPVQSQPVFLLFPNQNAGETMPMTVKLTKLDF